MPKIFISYRRNDTEHVVGSIAAYFKREFGAENVFLDVLDIHPGDDWPAKLRDKVAECDVMLVIIGPQWESIMRERAAQTDDFVRFEITHALHLNKLIIPVTVMSAPIPKFSDLPASVTQLERLNAVEIRTPKDFDNDCAHIADHIRQQNRTPIIKVAIFLLATLAIIIAVVIYSSLSMVTANGQWNPVIESFDDGIEMVQVPRGCFMMGSDDGEANEQPVHKVCFYTPFWIDRFEVTQANFARLDGEQGEEPAFSGDFRPIENITWNEALAHCQSRDARLPTEAEWEYAARGPDNLDFPGREEFEEFDPDNFIYEGSGKTADVGEDNRSGGVSWVGAYDMSGNVNEWVSTIYDPDLDPYPYPYKDDGREDLNREAVSRGVRGGSWKHPGDLLRAASRGMGDPSKPYETVGFRCARDW